MSEKETAEEANETSHLVLPRELEALLTEAEAVATSKGEEALARLRAWLQGRLGGPPEYDNTHGDDRLCECSHTYYRHFDSYDGMEPAGCKYCGCTRFVEGPHKHRCEMERMTGECSHPKACICCCGAMKTDGPWAGGRAENLDPTAAAETA